MRPTSTLASNDGRWFMPTSPGPGGSAHMMTSLAPGPPRRPLRKIGRLDGGLICAAARIPHVFGHWRNETIDVRARQRRRRRQQRHRVGTRLVAERLRGAGDPRRGAMVVRCTDSPVGRSSRGRHRTTPGAGLPPDNATWGIREMGRRGDDSGPGLAIPQRGEVTIRPIGSPMNAR